MIVLQTLLYLLWVNLLPPAATLLFGDRLDQPLDGGRLWKDGRPLLGSHKTLRGLLCALAGGTLAAPLLGVPWWVASVAALLAMAGDLLSSFVKRRFAEPSGDPSPVLDQTFESLFPALFLVHQTHLTLGQGLAAVALFIPLAYLGSRSWSYAFYRPPAENYLRIVRSSVRLKEWRACHGPLARWQTWLNFEDYVFYRGILAWVFRRLGLYSQGVRNVLAVPLEEVALSFASLPPAFDGFRILLLTDLHLDGLESLTDAAIARVQGLEVDLCLIGGDIRMAMYGPMAPSVRRLRQLLEHVRAAHGVLGVPGNHDCIEMLPELEAAGVVMLVNDAWAIEHAGQRIWVAGVDDPHYYRCHDLARAFRQVPDAEFSIFLAHSPELYAEAVRFRPQLYLCGHTHGGQIRLPGRGPIFTHSSSPRYMAAGCWEYHGMQGYTSRGLGASGVPLRFNCPGEITVLTLKREPAAG